MCSDNSIVVIPFQVWWVGESWSDYLASGKRRTKEKTEEKNKSNDFNEFVVVSYLMTSSVPVKKKKKLKSYSVHSLVFNRAKGLIISSEALFKIHCFPCRIKKMVKRRRRRTRRNKNPSVGGPLWNPPSPPTRPAASPNRPTVKVNPAPEVQGTACAPHHSQLEPRVLWWPGAGCMWALRSLLCPSTEPGSSFRSIKINSFDFNFSNTSQADQT